MNVNPPGGDHVTETIRRVSDHPLKRSFDGTPSDTALRSEDGWVDMDVRWLLTRDTVGAEHSVFGITVFPPGSKLDICVADARDPVPGHEVLELLRVRARDRARRRRRCRAR